MSFLGALTGSDATDAIKDGIQKNMNLMNKFERTSDGLIKNFGVTSEGFLAASTGVS